MLKTRKNLSGELTDTLRSRILTGKLTAGQRINEVQLAEALGVSRTPLREALTALVGEDFVQVEPRRGFFVAPFDADEFRNLYAIRAILDPQALELSGLPDSQQIGRLESINQDLARETRTSRRIDLDDAWHLALLSHCPNPILLDLVRQFMRRTRRYEHAFMSDDGLRETTVRQHGEILDAVRKHRLDRAIDALRGNLKTGTDPILEKLSSLEVSKGEL